MFTFNLRQLVISDERIDEEVRQYILSLFRAYIKDPNVTSITTGLVNVYKDYNGVAEYFYDMQDFHHFKMTVELRYFNKNCK
jgi:ribosome-binding factor A